MPTIGEPAPSASSFSFWKVLGLLLLAPLLFSLVLPGFFTLRGFNFTSLVAALGGWIFFGHPREFVAELPLWLRRTLIFCFVYSLLVTMGNGGELRSVTTWLDFLLLRDGAPWTSINTTAFFSALLVISGVNSSESEDTPIPQEDSEEILSGPQLIPMARAQEIATTELAPGEPSIFWAGLLIPESSAPEHFCIVGSPGSGKTLSMQLLMLSVLPRILPGSNRRAIIYDAKRDTRSVLAGMGISAPVVMLNPFDRRCSPWHMARDIPDGATAQQIASILIPKSGHESQPFFIEAAQAVLGGLLEAFGQIAGDRWTLRDVVLTLRYTHRIAAILDACEHTRYIGAKFITGSKRDSDIEATIETVMRRFAFVAAAWHHSTEKPVSLADWLKSDSVLILGSDPGFDTILVDLNRAIFRRLTELVRKQSEVKPRDRQTWFFIDELRNAGHLSDLDKFLVEGRSKGACLVLGFQDIEGLRDNYGEKGANEIVGACANKVFLHNGDQMTIKYATEHFKSQDILETRVSQSHSEGSSSSAGGGSSNTQQGHSVSRQRVTRPVVSEGLLKALPKPKKGSRGIAGYCDTACVGTEFPYRMELTPEFLEKVLPHPDESIPNLIPRESAELLLPDWTADDLRRLGLESIAPVLLKTHPQNSHERQQPKPAEPKPEPPAKPAAEWEHDIFKM
ncbi:MAG: type IV secretion system DNA-binding domain-containing protein [Verrucomicrobiales bacterium]